MLAHAIVNAALAAASGEGKQGAIAAAAGAVTGEATAIIAVQGFGKDPSQLSEEEKQTISTLATLASGLAGALLTDSGTGTITAAQAGKTTAENNSLGGIAAALAKGKTPEQVAGEQVEAENERYKKENCTGLSAEACSVKMYNERREGLKTILLTGADFVPVVGTIKSVVEAESALDYLEVAASLIPGERVAARILKIARKALKKGDISEASRLINKASDEIRAVKPLDVSSYKELKAREVVGDNLEHDHIPSFAALKKSKETELGRPLTDTETKNLYQNATAVEVPKDVHQSGPTYGSKNTPAQVQKDAIDLCGAECRDTDALRNNMIKRGYDPKLVDDAVKKIKERNHKIGVTK